MMKEIIIRIKSLYPFLFLLLAGSSLSGQSDLTIPSVNIHTDRTSYIAGEELWFNIYLVDRLTLRPESKTRLAYLELLNAEENPVIQKRILIDKGSGPGCIHLPDTLSTGSYTIVVYTNYMKNFASADFLHKTISIYNALNHNTFRSSLPVGMQVSRVSPDITPAGEEAGIVIISPDSAGTRAPVNLEIRTTAPGPGDTLNLTSMSISVAPLVGQDAPSNQYQSGRWTGRENSDSLPEINYPPESEFHFLTGFLMDMNRMEKIPHQRILMFAPGRQPDFQYAITDDEGSFRLNLHIDGENKDLILMPESQISSHKIVIGSSFPDISGHTAAKTVPVMAPISAEDLSTNYQVRKIYGTADTSGYMDPVTQPLRKVRFYGKPDVELHMADYVTLPAMDEVFFEILPHVSLRKKSTGYKVAVTDRVANTKIELSPVLLIDGVRISDASLIAGLDPSMVDKIDVINGMYRVGSYTFTGIVNVISKNADFRVVPLEDYMTRLRYTVIDPVPCFTSPSYQSKESIESPVPDFRNTLFWSPSARTGKDGSLRVRFWTSDISGGYRISVMGFNRAGKLISLSKILTVK